MLTGCPVVTLHGDLGVTMSAPIDVTAFVQSVAWMDSVVPPWETIDLELEVPLPLLRQVLPSYAVGTLKRPTPGFWVVLWTPAQNGALAAIAWGYCDGLQTGQVTDDETGQVRAAKLSIACESWLSQLGKSHLVLSAGGDFGPNEEGFVYRLQSWAPNMKALLQGVAQEKQNPGEILAKLWAAVVKMRVPTSLVPSDGQIGTQIPVVHDRPSALGFAPLRAAQHLEVPGFALNAAANALPSATVWQWLEASFGADPSLVEVFPSLEFPTWQTDGDDEDAGNGVPAFTAVGKALGAQPVLVYRLRPFLHEAITRDTIARAKAADGDTSPTGKPRAQTAGMFQEPIDPEPFFSAWYTFPAHEIRQAPSLVWSNADRVNAVYVRTPIQPRSQVELYGILGMPVVDRQDVAAHGLRLREVVWPFFPPVLSEADKSSMIDKIDALIEFAWQVLGRGHLYVSCTVETVYKPWTKKGHWASLELVPGSLYLNGYIEEATHRYRVVDPDSGEFAASTSLRIVRGSLKDKPYAFDVQVATAHRNPVPPPDVTFDPVDPTEPTPPEDFVQAGPTQSFPWTALLCRNQPTTQQIANLKRLAKNLEIIQTALGVSLTITPNGGLHGAWQDANWTINGQPKRKASSQHRKGKAADFIPGGLDVAVVVAKVQDLIAQGKIDPGGVYSYAGDPFVHYDIRGVSVPVSSASDAQEDAT